MECQTIVFCCETLNYAVYIEEYIASKEYSFTYKAHTWDDFELSSVNERIELTFEARQFWKMPSELIFVQSVLKRLRLSSLAFGIVCINKRVTYITNEVLTSRHDCVFERSLVIWNYLKSWLAAHCVRGTVQCIVKILSLRHVILYKEISSFVSRGSVPL